MNRLGRIALPLAALAIAGCEGGGADWTGTVTDSAGVAMVANPGEGLWSASSAWRLEEELRIG